MWTLSVIALGFVGLTLTLHQRGSTWSDATWPTVVAVGLVVAAVIVGLVRRTLPRQATRDVVAALDRKLSTWEPHQDVPRDDAMRRVLVGATVLLLHPRDGHAYVVDARPTADESAVTLGLRRLDGGTRPHDPTSPFFPGTDLAIGSTSDGGGGGSGS